MKLYLCMAIAVLPLLAASGCGDVKSAQEVLGNRAREQSNLRRLEIDPLQGEYNGYLHDARSDRKSRFVLNIIRSGAPYDGAEIPEEITTPTLAASAHLYSTDLRSETYIRIAFNTSDYNVDSGHLGLFSDEKDSSLLIQLPQGKAPEPIETLRGRYVSAAEGTIGDFVVSRVR